jgi:ring-1,2-phenylacetyl-CoA epoxidase subunit PaaC
MMRQFFFDTWHYFLMKGCCNSSDARIAEIAEKSLKEVTYHLRRSGDLVVRLGDGTDVSHAEDAGRRRRAVDLQRRMFIYDASTRPWWPQGVAPAAAGAARRLPRARGEISTKPR